MARQKAGLRCGGWGLLALGALLAATGAQEDNYYRDYSEADSPRAPPPAILTHKQSVTDDGVFNYVFAADNGLKQGESISPDGTRTGAYQYVDPSGKTISVKYMAGKDGFRIIEGDHIPHQPQPVEPIPEYQPPEYRKDYQPQEQHRQDDRPRERFEERQRNNKYTTQEYIRPKHLFQPEQQERPQSEYRQDRQQDRQQGYQQDRQQAYQQDRQQGYQQDRQQGYQQSRQQQGARPSQPKGPNRAMLYNVEQRHSVSYRKYNDDGQLAGSADGAGQQDAPQPAPHFGGGYNFEFKG